jgi:hypothetical protein
MDYDALLQSVLTTLIEVLLPVLLGVVIYWIKQQAALVKARIPAEQLEFASGLARQFVLAAEQSGLAGYIKDAGLEKKEWVLLRLESALAQKGIRLDMRTLSDLVEAQVYDAIRKSN